MMLAVIMTYLNQQFNNNQNLQVEATASIVVSDEKTLTDSYEANNTDESVILVENGGNLTFNANKQNLNGNIEVYNISTLVLNLENSSYSGTINGDNNAKNIAITLDSNSTITLTGNSYVTSLKNDDTSYSNINFNRYKLYVNGKSIN